MSKELYIPLHVTTDDAGNIEKIVLTDRLPVMEVDFLGNLLACLARAKKNNGEDKQKEDER